MATEDTEESRPLLSYPCGDPPGPGLALEVAPGVCWLRMPLPFTLAHINLWALRDDDGWALVDTGVQSVETTAAWRQLFGEGGESGTQGFSTAWRRAATTPTVQEFAR